MQLVCFKDCNNKMGASTQVSGWQEVVCVLCQCIMWHAARSLNVLLLKEKCGGSVRYRALQKGWFWKCLIC